MPTGLIDLDETDETEDDSAESPSVPPGVVGDNDDDDSPVVSALESRARDLSLSIVNPATLATKLRESLLDIAGPDAAVTYHIGASYDNATRQVNVQIARVSPSFVALLKADSRSTSLGLAYQKRTDGGWNVAVGVQVETDNPFTKQKVTAAPGMRPPLGSNLKASFSVTVSR